MTDRIMYVAVMLMFRTRNNKASISVIPHFSIMLRMLWICSGESSFFFANADMNAGNEPSKRFSTSSSISEICASSFEMMELTIVFSFFITPLSHRRFITV